MEISQCIDRMKTLQDLQHEYPFKQPLSIYTMGVSGKPEQREQKAFVACLMAEFAEELGHDEDLNIYSRLIVATSDFYSGGKYRGKQMNTYKKMGYQPGTPDITILYPSGSYHGFVCEIKSQKGKPTEQQTATLNTLATTGFYTCIGDGFEGALNHWLKYLKERDK